MEKLPVGDLKISGSLIGKGKSMYKSIVLEDSEKNVFFMHLKHFPMVSKFLKNNYFIAEEVSWSFTTIGGHRYIAPSHLVGKKRKSPTTIWVEVNKYDEIVLSYTSSNLPRVEYPRKFTGTFEVADIYKTRSTMKASCIILDGIGYPPHDGKKLDFKLKTIFKKFGCIPKTFKADVVLKNPGVLIAHVI